MIVAPTILDASCVIALTDVQEKMHIAAVTLIRRLDEQNATLMAPALFDYEIETVLRLKVFRFTVGAKNASPFNESDATNARTIIAALSIEIVHDPTTIKAAYSLARDYGQARVYDACYATLAQSRGAEFWTADKDFHSAVNGPNMPAKKRLTFVRYIEEALG